MRVTVITKLTAPGGGVALEVASVAEQEGDELIRGSVLAPGRGLYPIVDGILDLLPGGAGILSTAQSSNLLGLTARGYEWPWRTYSLSLMSRQSLPLPREREIVREMLGELQGTLWLDLAASTALYGRWLAHYLLPTGGEVISLDLAWPMLEEAQRRSRAERRQNLSFVRGRGESLPFATGTVDGVVCGGSLNEFGPAGASIVLREVARALKPEGVGLFMHLLTAQGQAAKMMQRALTRGGGVAFWNRPATNRLFEERGLQVEEAREFGVVGFTRVRKVAGQ